MRRLLSIGVALTFIAWPSALQGQQKKQQCQLQGSPNAHLAQQMLNQAQDTTRPESQRQAAYRQAWNAVSGPVSDGTDNPTPYILGAQAQVGLNNFMKADSLLTQFVSKAGAGCGKLAHQVRFQAWAKLYNSAIRDYQSGNTDEALAQFEDANAIYDDARSLVNAAALHEQEGETAKAMKRYRQALDVGGQPTQVRKALRALARHELQNGNTQEALDLYKKFLADNPDDVSVKVDYAQALSNAGQSDSAEAVFASMLSRDDLNFQQWSQLGVGLYQAGAYERATRAFRNARQEKPLDKDVMGNLASSLEMTSKWKELKPLADTLVKWYPYDGQINRSAIKAYDNLGQTKEAQRLLNRLQEAPFQFAQLSMQAPGGNSYMVTGQLQTTSSDAAGQTMTVPFEFLDSSGNVVTTEKLSVQLPEQGSSTSVQLRVQTSQDVATFRYSPPSS